MASLAKPFDDDDDPPETRIRVYAICFFDRGHLVPHVKLLDASSDEEAIMEARSSNPWTRRELWDRHRLVANIQAAPEYVKAI